MKKLPKGLGLVCAAALLAGSAYGAEPGKAAKVEAIAGSSVKQVTLTAKGAERLGIQTAAVREAAVARKWVVGGDVVSSPSPGLVGGKEPAATLASATPASAAAAGGRETWVRVILSERELEKVAQDQLARVLLPAHDGKANASSARPSKTPPETRRDGTVALYYSADRAGDVLQPGKRVRVELPLAGSSAPKKVIPHSAVLYDAKGASWAYVSPAPLKYVRHKIAVDYVEGDLAVLSEGPAAGAMVVTVGASLLYGAETQGK
jgi:hypothetical protein